MPAIPLFVLDRTAVLAGDLVLARWRTENATTLRVTLPDGGYVDLDAMAGAGEHRFLITRSGVITATAYGWSGPPAMAQRSIAVFDIPQPTRVPVPDLGAAPMPVFGRTPVPIMDRTGLGAALAAATAGAPGGARLPTASNDLTAGHRSRPPAFATPPVELLTIAAVRSAPRATPDTGGWWARITDRRRLPVDLIRLFTSRRIGRPAMRRGAAR